MIGACGQRPLLDSILPEIGFGATRQPDGMAGYLGCYARGRFGPRLRGKAWFYCDHARLLGLEGLASTCKGDGEDGVRG